MQKEILGLRIPGADGLRAIACLLVVWHHTAQKLNPENASPLIGALHFLGMRGEVGVSLFFVLSGCLLSLPFWSSFVNKKAFPSIKRYSIHRAARIAPAFWLNLIACNILAIWLFNLDFNWQKFSSGFLFINSYHYSTFFPSEINGPLWSIGLEVSCYVLLPLVLFVIFKAAKKVAFAVTWLVAVIVSLQILNPQIIQVFMTDNIEKGWQFGIDGGAKQWLPYWNIGSFFTQFLIGSLAALIVVHLRSKQRATRRVFDIGFLASIAAATLVVIVRLTPGVPDTLTQQPYVSPFFALCVASALVFASHSVYAARLLDNRLFTWLAKLSFGIYLWHVVVMEIISRKFIANYVYAGINDVAHWMLISAVVLLVSITIAAASWRWLESPILKAMRREKNFELR
jgi:peptidoglycan/LPS O-acetylase OafA/YrhL